MFIQYKLTTWERINLPSNITKKQLEILKRNINTTDFFNPDIIMKWIDNVSYESNDEVSDAMSCKDNKGFSTIELYDNNEIIAENGINI